MDIRVPKVSPEILASQIAYADLDKALSQLQEQHIEPTLAAVLKVAHDSGSGMQHLQKYLDNNGQLLPPNDFANDWTLLSAKNENQHGGTGFYGCILDTGDTRILALRGSESMSKLDNLEQDWLKSDLGLLNAEISPQDAALARYMMENKDLLSEKNWSSAGHSLGGELSDFASIMAVKMGLDYLYLGSTSLDGPGLSNEKIQKFSKEISIVGEKNRHYIASFVGEMLSYFPGAEQVYIDVSKDSQFLDYPKQETGLDSMNRHDTKNWILNEDGIPVAVEGQTDMLANMSRVLSRGLDVLPSAMGDFLVQTISTLWYGSAWVSDAFKNNPEGATAVAVSALAVILAVPAVREVAIVAIASVIAAVVASIGIALAAVVVGSVFEFIKTTISKIANLLFGQKASGEDNLKNIAESTGQFVTRFEGKFPELTKVSIREVNEAVAEFETKVKTLSKGGNITLKPRSESLGAGGGYAARMAANAANSGKVAANLDELRKVKDNATALLNEITNRIKITAKARSAANEATGQHTQNYVRTDANNVLNSCSKLESESNRALDELKSLVKGLETAINGYQQLEREYA